MWSNTNTNICYSKNIRILFEYRIIRSPLDGHSCLYFSNWFIILIIIVTYAYASVIYELWDKEFLYFPWVCWGMGWIYGWGLFLETNCQYPRLILHNILHINQDFRRGKSTKSIFIWKLYSIPSIKTSCWPVFDICHYQFVITSF